MIIMERVHPIKNNNEIVVEWNDINIEVTAIKINVANIK